MSEQDVKSLVYGLGAFCFCTGVVVGSALMAAYLFPYIAR